MNKLKSHDVHGMFVNKMRMRFTCSLETSTRQVLCGSCESPQSPDLHLRSKFLSSFQKANNEISDIS